MDPELLEPWQSLIRIEILGVSFEVIPGTADSGSTWSGYAVVNLRLSGCPAGIGEAQLSVTCSRAAVMGLSAASPSAPT